MGDIALQSQLNQDISLADNMKQVLDPAEQIDYIRSLSDEQAIALLHDWEFWARPNQKLPLDELDWDTWLPLAGRGWGKTRACAEGIKTLVETGEYERLALIGPTAGDVRDVMIEGESGLLSIFSAFERPVYNPSKRLVTFKNGATAHCYSAEDPESLRGPQHHAGWCDELCAWRYCEDTWDMFQFGLRLGKRPLAIVGTTPKPTKFLKELISDESTFVVRGNTYENKSNLAARFIKAIDRKYSGTRLGRQEINAEILDDNPNALFSRDDIEEGRIRKRDLPPLKKIVVGVDPAVTNTEESDETGIVAAGIDYDDEIYILADVSLLDAISEWALAAVNCYDDLEANLIIGEANNGGDMIESVIRQAETSPKRIGTGKCGYNKVHATRGKAIRAEPVTLLYEQHKVHHVGTFPKMEDEMCEFDPTLKPGEQDSPNRMDALVWAVVELIGKSEREVRVMVVKGK